MKDSAAISATTALADLMDVSPQVVAAIVMRRSDDTLIASDQSTPDRAAQKLAGTCSSMFAAAEQARQELGREPIVQIEVGTARGHVFIATDNTWLIAAVTELDPTVGLVFYDLKTALRSMRESTLKEPDATQTQTSDSAITSDSALTPDSDPELDPASSPNELAFANAPGSSDEDPSHNHASATSLPPQSTSESTSSKSDSPSEISIAPGRRWRRKNR